ncbi:MAG: serine--tRNA ligase [Candidatus Westeberhardia cardiocondylae]|nr:serine--tRNA ligase [Candidatus Westeberhardia cardiocondylae]
MLNVNLLRYNIEKVAKGLLRKNFVLNINFFREKQKKRKFLQCKLENLQFQRNVKSRMIGIKKNLGKNIQELFEEVKLINSSLKIVKNELNLLKKIIYDDILTYPNIPDEHIPDGFCFKKNKKVFSWGTPKQFDFSIRNHIELGNIIDGLDFSSAVKLSGSRFVVMKGSLAYMHRALVQFMLDIHIKYHGYKEYSVPYLVNNTALYGSGQLPILAHDLYYVHCMRKNKMHYIYTLIPTAEVPLVNLLKNKIMTEEMLPLKIVAHTPCFRAEAGAYGRNDRGLIRMHQFEKIEMVQVVKPENSMNALEEITGHAEKILQLLNLPYRKVLLCAGELGFASCKTYDLEVWFPSLNSYCEISSCSNTSDFQSRRIKSRYKEKHNKQLQFVHMLNGSGLAVSRTLAAILENYQLSNGVIEIPSILQSYMNGLTYIGK